LLLLVFLPPVLPIFVLSTELDRLPLLLSLLLLVVVLLLLLLLLLKLMMIMLHQVEDVAVMMVVVVQLRRVFDDVLPEWSGGVVVGSRDKWNTRHHRNTPRRRCKRTSA
jgi:hypothetical protein